MFRVIIVLFLLSSLFRRPRMMGFPFVGMWGHRRPPMGPRHGMRGPFRGGPHGMF